MTKQAMATSGPKAPAASPAMPSNMAMSSATFVKYTAIMLHAVFLVCIVVLVWVLVTSDKRASGSIPMKETVQFQSDIADGLILMSFRRYDQAEERFRLAATKISELSDKQEYSGKEFGHLRAAEGGALQMAENCRTFAEAERTSTYIRGARAFKVQAKLAMDSGLKAMKEKD